MTFLNGLEKLHRAQGAIFLITGPSLYIDGIAIVRRGMLDVAGLPLVIIRSMGGEGAGPQNKIARKTKKGEGVSAFPKLDKEPRAQGYQTPDGTFEAKLRE